MDQTEMNNIDLSESTNGQSHTSEGEGSVLVWKDLKVVVKAKKKVLLDGVSGKITGGFWAIMGPSGCGKSTLLNALACRLDQNVKLSGEVKLNGKNYSRSDVKWVGGYVMQDDVLNGLLTVQETMTYTAKLRLPPSISEEERIRICDEALEKMGLSHTKDVLVGNPLVKGISGGERKRLCVAMELIMNPKLLFLDEPTSGLDSVAALVLVTRLKELTDAGKCTVVCTIHQPQAKIFRQFDSLYLLKQGNVVFQGRAQDALLHFANGGYPCPEFENPADHFLDVMSPMMNPNNIEEDDFFKDSTTITDQDLLIGNDKKILPRDIVPWWKQFLVLLHRSFKEQWRKWDIIAIQLLQSLIMAVLVGTVYLKIGNTQNYINTRQSVLFFCCINQGVFGALITINSFPSERMLSLRERAAGTYYVSAYFLAKNVAETATQIASPVLFSSVVYFMIGFQPYPGKFFIFMLFMILTSVSATSMAVAVSTLGRTTDMAVTILPFLFELTRLFGGFFLPPSRLPLYYSWIDAVSYLKYAYIGISINELEGLKYNCTPAQLITVNQTTLCPIVNGSQVMRDLGIDFINIGGCIGVLIGLNLACRFLAFLGAKYIKW